VRVVATRRVHRYCGGFDRATDSLLHPPPPIRLCAALGTLYAYQNASKLAKDSHSLDIDAELRAGKISVGLYHTAGTLWWA